MALIQYTAARYIPTNHTPLFSPSVSPARVYPLSTLLTIKQRLIPSPNNDEGGAAIRRASSSRLDASNEPSETSLLTSPPAPSPSPANDNTNASRRSRPQRVWEVKAFPTHDVHNDVAAPSSSQPPSPSPQSTVPTPNSLMPTSHLPRAPNASFSPRNLTTSRPRHRPTITSFTDASASDLEPTNRVCLPTYKTLHPPPPPRPPLLASINSSPPRRRRLRSRRRRLPTYKTKYMQQTVRPAVPAPSLATDTVPLPTSALLPTFIYTHRPRSARRDPLLRRRRRLAAILTQRHHRSVSSPQPGRLLSTSNSTPPCYAKTAALLDADNAVSALRALTRSKSAINQIFKSTLYAPAALLVTVHADVVV
ncbi:hypothetical protein R3P38DRAFT_3257595 [Favolaschia claudopus]|uniref:Uncharacterized protein n=1 Tax=Favolaschia claudopus TaxID=2862362 RepID=A0AAW0DCF6_9AGAR